MLSITVNNAVVFLFWFFFFNYVPTVFFSDFFYTADIACLLVEFSFQKLHYPVGFDYLWLLTGTLMTVFFLNNQAGLIFKPTVSLVLPLAQLQ